jgi:hypothetical protein
MPQVTTHPPLLAFRAKPIFSPAYCAQSSFYPFPLVHNHHSLDAFNAQTPSPPCLQYSFYPLPQAPKHLSPFLLPLVDNHIHPPPTCAQPFVNSLLSARDLISPLPNFSLCLQCTTIIPCVRFTAIFLLPGSTQIPCNSCL